MSVLSRHVKVLDALKSRNLYRELTLRKGHDFSSNDYLGLAESEVLRNAALAALEQGVGVGSGGSRLLRGNTEEHGLLETEAKKFFNVEQALFFNDGFSANTAIFSSLPGHGDLIAYDALIHASARDGMRLGRAEKIPFRHNDENHCADVIKNWHSRGGKGQVWIAFESVYSMDGNLAPINEFTTLARQNDAIILIDEAHATGVFGNSGRGLAHTLSGRENVLSLHTCGKAMGGNGALACGAKPLIETLINRARGFIYSTALSPLNAAITRAGLKALQEMPQLQSSLHCLMRYAHSQAEQHFGISGLQSQIIPVIIGDDKQTMKLAGQLQKRGFDIRGIRPPTVPRGSARLRLSLTLNVSRETVNQMFLALAQELRGMK